VESEQTARRRSCVQPRFANSVISLRGEYQVEQPLRRAQVVGPVERPAVAPQVPRLDRGPAPHPAPHRGPTSNPALRLKSRTLVDPAQAEHSSKDLRIRPARRLSRVDLAQKAHRSLTAKPIRHQNNLTKRDDAMRSR
jgi:hypothetical protein